jgi:hypothetical protein
MATGTIFDAKVNYLLQGRTGFAAEQIALFDFLVATAAHQSDLHEFFCRISPAIVLDSYQLAAVTPRIGIRICAVVQITEEAQILSVNKMFAYESFMGGSVLIAPNCRHDHLGIKNLPQKKLAGRPDPARAFYPVLKISLQSFFKKMPMAPAHCQRLNDLIISKLISGAYCMGWLNREA